MPATDLIVVPGGFSYGDYLRSGAIAARSPVLMRNAGLRFVCTTVKLSVENADTVFTNQYDKGQVIPCPVAHHDGNYFADSDTL